MALPVDRPGHQAVSFIHATTRLATLESTRSMIDMCLDRPCSSQLRADNLPPDLFDVYKMWAF